MRLTLAGIGDPLLHPEFFEIVDAAHSAGINAISVETDLVGISPETIEHLAADRPLISFLVFVPAMTKRDL